MRKRIFIGNLIASGAAIGIVYGLAAAGLAGVGLFVVGALVVVLFTSIASIRVLNDLLARVSHVEEAVLRVTHGETGVRIGEVAQPLDGLAYRLDQVFEQLEQAASPKPGDDAER